MANNQLVLIGQLKAVISSLHSEGKLSFTDYIDLNDQLDVNLVDSVSSEPSLELLLNTAEKSLTNIDFAPLKR
jgi:hypothetical protein